MRGEDIEIQTLVCFSHPVPLQYVRTRLPEVSFLTLQGLKSGKL